MKKESSRLLQEILAEDDTGNDVTSSFTPDSVVKAEITGKSKGVLAGAQEAGQLFQMSKATVLNSMQDGEGLEGGETIFQLEGSSRKILSTERSALNLLSHMSGIATLTRRYVDAARKANPNVEVAATRKTIPFARQLEKKAVVIGGGNPHRFSLADAILIKDNHLKLFDSIASAINAAQKANKPPIEIEVEDKAQALEAAQSGADIIMLDNFSPPQIIEAIEKLEKEGLRAKVKLEASGGIILDNIADYAATGVDLISVGRLTQSAPALDFSLEILD